MKAIVKRRQRRKLVEVEKKPLKFTIRGREVDDQKINRFMKRYGIPESLLYFPTPGAGWSSPIATAAILMEWLYPDMGLILRYTGSGDLSNPLHAGHPVVHARKSFEPFNVTCDPGRRSYSTYRA